MSISSQRTESIEKNETPRKNDIVAEEINLQFETADGFPLAGTLFTPNEETPSRAGPLVLISSATGAPRGFYRNFALALVSSGSRGVLTYDYRGMPDSPRPPDFRGRINMRDWAHYDMPAAMTRLDQQAPGHSMVGVGQSFGGQALGICGMPERFDRFCMVACLSGYWRHTDTAWRNMLKMNVVGVPLATVLGKTPRWMGLGEPFPASVFRDWAKWCFHPEYFFDDPAVGARAGYATVNIPVLSIGLTDDPWGTPRAIGALLKHYVDADIEER